MSKVLEDLEFKVKQAIESYYPNLKLAKVDDDSKEEKKFYYEGSFTDSDPISFTRDLDRAVGSEDAKLIRSKTEAGRFRVSLSKRIRRRTRLNSLILWTLTATTFVVAVGIAVGRLGMRTSALPGL